MIILRFVTKGRKGTITYLIKIDLIGISVAASRWTIASGTKAYEGLHGKGTEERERELHRQYPEGNRVGAEKPVEPIALA